MLRIPGAISPAKPLVTAIAIGCISSVHADGISIGLPAEGLNLAITNPSCATYTVNATPATDTPETLTLDEALALFSSECTAASDSAAITIADSLAGEVLSNGISLTLDNGRHLSIASNAATPPVITVESNAYPLLFDANESATLSLQNLKLVGSYAADTANAAESRAIRLDSATLNLNKVIARDFYVSDTGPVIRADNSASVIITDSVFEDNISSNNKGGAIAILDNNNGTTSLTITDSEFNNNSTASASGGALYAENADLTITDSVFTNNQASTDGISAFNGGGAVAAVGGAGEFNKSKLTITGSTFSNNQSRGDGGALLVDSSNPVTITDSIFESNTSDSVFLGATYSQARGGAISMKRIDATLSGNIFSDNRAQGQGVSGDGLGGALYIGDTNYARSRTGGEITITDSTFQGNSAVAEVSTSNGGGIYIEHNDGRSATVTVARSTLSQNNAQEGGALAHQGNDGALTITNSTISANSASTSAAGLYFGDPVTHNIRIAHSTIVNNSLSGMDTVGSGLFSSDGSGNDIAISHTVIANNSGGAGNVCATGEGTLEFDHSLISDAGVQAGCGSISLDESNLVGSNDAPLDAELQDLGLYDGTTFTFMPSASSPLIDAGDTNIENAPETDQRGEARIFNGTIDIGAVERGANNNATITIPGSGGGGGTLGVAFLSLLGLLGLRRKP